MGKSARFQAWSYTGTNFDQLLGGLGVLGRSAPSDLVEGRGFSGDTGGLYLQVEAGGNWQILEHRDDNKEPATKGELEQLGISVAKLA